jgi:hypothetical protein
MSYATVRDEIKNQLEAVAGIGKVFTREPYTTNMDDFLTLYADRDSQIVKITWFLLDRVQETPTGVNTITDAENLLHDSEKHEFWKIISHYSHKDDGDNPSEFAFQEWAGTIEDKFRFLQNLNGKCEISRPLQRTYSGLGKLGNMLCHRAEWTLELIYAVENPAIET